MVKLLALVLDESFFSQGSKFFFSSLRKSAKLKDVFVLDDNGKKAAGNMRCDGLERLQRLHSKGAFGASLILYEITSGNLQATRQH